MHPCSIIISTCCRAPRRLRSISGEPVLDKVSGDSDQDASRNTMDASARLIISIASTISMYGSGKNAVRLLFSETLVVVALLLLLCTMAVRKVIPGAVAARSLLVVVLLMTSFCVSCRNIFFNACLSEHLVTWPSICVPKPSKCRMRALKCR